MSFWGQLLGRENGTPAGNGSRSLVPSRHFSPNVTFLGGTPFDGDAALMMSVSAWTSAQMWKTQPQLRTVVSFLGRNVAHCALQVFERVDETSRRRDRDSPLAEALRRPDVDVTAYELIYALVVDLCLYDTAYWLVLDGEDGAKRLRRLPPAWVSPVLDDAFTVSSYDVSTNGGVTNVPADRVLRFPGFHPMDPTGCSPTIEALKETLQEQISSAQYRNQVWKRGGRVSAVIKRPEGAPEWSREQASRFKEDWNAKFTGNGPGAGGTPLLEDGMSLERVDFNAREQEFVEGAKLAFSTVASAYHVNPTMLGQNDSANYSNVVAFSRMLYVDTLGPMFALIEDRINTFLLPMLGMDGTRFYAEFNIDEKMQGDFASEAAAMSSAGGGPWMTRNEIRARKNLPAVEGGDALVTPLNVTEGGQASPRDSGSQNDTGADPEPPRPPKSGDAVALLERMERVVKSRRGAGAQWWDVKRWEREAANVVDSPTAFVEDVGRALASGADMGKTFERLRARYAEER